jgi:hypothetical protein
VKWGLVLVGCLRARGRFEVRDARGALMPLKPEQWVSGDPGRFSYGMLKFGESYDVVLELSRYIQPLLPGRDRVVIRYHNSRPIAGVDHPDLILFSSDPFDLIVKPAGPASRPATAPR